MQKNKELQTHASSAPEHILVVKRDILFSDLKPWHGLLQTDMNAFMQIIQKNSEFHPRPTMEEDTGYKQIIPYLVFEHNNTYFLMQRKKTASEKRLQNKYTLGIGGHIRKEDFTSNSIFDWAKREFHEEVNYSGKVKIEPLGILNDDTNMVGRVHLGLVLLLHGDSPEISVKSELAYGSLCSMQECNNQYAKMETWSQFITNQLFTQ